MAGYLWEMALFSVPIIILFGFLVIFWAFYRRGRDEKRDYSNQISSFETLYKEKKISKEEYNRIKMALLKKEGIDIPEEAMQKLDIGELKPITKQMDSIPSAKNEENKTGEDKIIEPDSDRKD